MSQGLLAHVERKGRSGCAARYQHIYIYISTYIYIYTYTHIYYIYIAWYVLFYHLLQVHVSEVTSGGQILVVASEPSRYVTLSEIRFQVAS